jgi:hypothetical protein
MKTIEIESMGKMSSLDLSYVIFFWKEYEPNSVVIAYDELVKRNYPISGNFYDKITEFRKRQLLLDNEQELKQRNL